MAATPCQSAAGQGHVRSTGIIDLLDRMGVPFNRTAGGTARLPPLRRHAVQAHRLRRSHPGQQLLYALDEQVRRYESEGKVRKFERWESLSAVLDSNRVCRGISPWISAPWKFAPFFPADAIIMATGGNG